MAVLQRFFQVSCLILIISMLLSIINKKSVPLAQSLFKTSVTTSSRSFFFGSGSGPGSSSSASSGSSSGSGSSSSSSWSSSKSYSSTSAQSANASVPPATSSTASLNYDTALTTFTHYNVAVAYQPKDRKPSTNLFKKRNREVPALNSPSGEDNLFVSNQTRDGSIAVGVADGVGGWSEAGYDSSAISRELCASIKYAFEKEYDTQNSITPKDLLVEAFRDVTFSEKVEIGGTTACLGIFTPDKKLKVANLGDSWCGLFRDYKLIHETNFQTHNFNTPYQLAKIPQHILKQAELEGRRYIIDSPSMADEYTWNLQKNDIVMFATDGVTDNVVPQDIEIFLKDNLEDRADKDAKLDVVTNKFVKEVVNVSKDSNFPSAFAQELSRITGQKYLGGKEDDITVVLVKVL